MFTSPAGAVAKYCDERMSVCVCLSVRSKNHWTVLNWRISPEPHARSLPKFCACCLWPWLGPPPAGWRNPNGKGQFWDFVPHWQCIVQHNINFGNHTKTAEPIEMPFGMMNWIGPRVTWWWRSLKKWGNFGGNMCPTSLTPIWIANWTGPCSCLHTTGADALLQAMNEYYRQRRAIAHRGRSLISTIVLFVDELQKYKTTVYYYWLT